MPSAVLLDTVPMAVAFSGWYAVAVTAVALAATFGRTPERRRGARDVLRILLRQNPR
ncbi:MULTISPECIES: hypothetical protein [unclassified Kitasatospora]|uniref:hypothetical protein n=1 Tax=unclassified Kitasatospora TaxID=2633591 RepID=UPI00247514FE|nr:hypothetical protein [Kitasatospora sp. MAP12-44]MDH6107824.1 hypothetical protein [Kitasatospora sp. MAP12-44]